jgi:hypothetical protein
VDLTRIHREGLLSSDYRDIPTRKSRALLLLLLLFTFSTEPGAYPDMENILSVYLMDTTLEDLPYVVGYGGEFCEGIFQQAGSRLIPGMSSFLYLVSTFDHFSQTVLGLFWIWNTYDAADVMLSIARPLLIEQVMLLAKMLLADHHQRHTLVFDVPYLLTPMLVPQIRLEMEKSLDRAMVTLVSLYSLQIKWRLIFSSGSPMAPGSLITTLWGLWRSVLAVVIIFLAAFLVLMSLPVPDDI